MGVNLSIKEVPEEIAELLRQRASFNHRSLQGELMAIIQRAAYEQPEVRQASPGEPVTRFGPGFQRGTKTADEIYAEQIKRWPEPNYDQPLGVDLIREDRDSR